MKEKYKIQARKRRKTNPPPKPSVQFRMENGSVVATMEPGTTPEQIIAHRAQLKKELEKPTTELEKLLEKKTSDSEKELEEVCESPQSPLKE